MAEKLNIEIGLTGDEEIKRQLAETASAFTQATSKISQLGNTMAEALNSAAVAAKKFGASADELAALETRIRAIGARARDGGLSFAVLAQKIDQASGATGKLVDASAGLQVSFATLARIGGVVGAAIVGGLAAATKSTIGFAQAVNKTSAEAIKLGVSFKQLDQLKLSMEQTGMSAQGISAGITALKGNLDKLEVSKLKKLAEEMAKVERLGVRFAPGQGPGALKQFEEAAKKIGPAGDFAREAIRRIREEAQKSGNVRFLPGVVPTLEQLKQNADPVIAGFNKLGIAATQVGEQSGLVTEKLKAMTDVAERNRLALLLMGEAGGTAFIQSLGSIDAQENAANKLVGAIERLTAAWNRFGSLTLAPTLTAGIDLITTALQTLQNAITNFGWETFGNAAKAAFDLIAGAISAFTLQGMLSWIAQAVVAWTGLGELIKRIVTSFQSASTPSLSDTGNVSGMAGGGLLGGRGTGTSDSNLAWLSRGEYVTPARAVAQPGVLSFLEALRRSGGNLSRVLNGMGHFALGGMVPRAIPAFAAGGLNSGSHVTIQFPGLPPISGLRASSNVVDQLHKAAALAQVRSGGRKPSRYS